MTLDRELLAEKAAMVERHLVRIEERLPAAPEALRPMTDASDAVILHLLQATQIVLDLAASSCVRLKLGTPTSYADAFRRLADASVLERGLAERLMLAAGFRNLVAHAYETLDMNRVYRAANEGPRDLRAFLSALGDAA